MDRRVDVEREARLLDVEVARLRELGYPVAARRGVAGGYGIAPGAALPPLLIDDDEVVAIAMGLRAAASGAVVGLQEPSLRALAKVSRVMPPRLRGRVEAIAATMAPAPVWSMGPRVDIDALVVVAEACRDRERIRFGYTRHDGATGPRETEPVAVVPVGRRLYLVAWDVGRRDWRSFRLDRVEEPAATGVRFAPRRLPAEDATAFVRSSVETMPRTHLVEAVVEAPEAHVTETIGRWAHVEGLADGRVRARMQVDGLEWPALALGMVGAPFEVLAPDELREMLAEWGGRFLRATGG